MTESARRALRILEVVGASPHPISVTEIARRLSITPGTAFRTLDALQRNEYAARYQASSRYVLGGASLRMRQSLFARFRIREIALPYLHQLASATGETTSLTIPLGWYGVRIAAIRGSNEVTTMPALGLLGPLAAHYIGRAILAFLPDEDLARYRAWSEKHRAEQASLDQLDTVRRRGFSHEHAGFEGRSALALPIRDNGRVIAALALEGPILDDTGAVAGSQAADWRDVARALEAAIHARQGQCRHPFAHLDPDTILFGEPE